MPVSYIIVLKQSLRKNVKFNLMNHINEIMRCAWKYIKYVPTREVICECLILKAGNERK